MKKSITFLGMALLAFGPVVFASNGSTTSNSNEFHSSINFTKSGDRGTRFVSSADPNLLSAELGSLKKYPKTIDEVIADDTKIIEATLIDSTKKLPVKKAKKNAPMKLKKAFKN